MTARKPAKAKAKRGRPTKRTPAIERKIIDGLSNGTPLTVICRGEAMPSDGTVRSWMDADPAFSAAIARAREVGFDVIAMDALAIIDEEPERVITITEGERSSERIDSAGVQRAKNRAELRLKLLAKWDPKRYGDKLDLVSTDGSLSQKPTEIVFLAPQVTDASDD